MTVECKTIQEILESQGNCCRIATRLELGIGGLLLSEEAVNVDGQSERTNQAAEWSRRGEIAQQFDM